MNMSQYPCIAFIVLCTKFSNFFGVRFLFSIFCAINGSFAVVCSLNNYHFVLMSCYLRVLFKNSEQKIDPNQLALIEHFLKIKKSGNIHVSRDATKLFVRQAINKTIFGIARLWGRSLPIAN